MIETVSVKDTKELLEIYKPYVLNTAITFEISVPSVKEFEKRIEDISKIYPYFKYVEDGEILAYAYASRLKSRKAYDYAVELSIYVKEDARKKGIGRKLYDALEQSLKEMNIKNMYACVTCDTNNSGSIGFHKKLGFKEVGHFHKCGYKFNKWYDVVWFEKMIGKHNENEEWYL